MVGTDVLTCDCKDVLYPRAATSKAAPAGGLPGTIDSLGCIRCRNPFIAIIQRADFRPTGCRNPPTHLFCFNSLPYPNVDTDVLLQR